MFKEMVHVDGEKAYKNLVKSIKEISLRFVDDLRNATVPAVVRSIRRKDGQHFKNSLSLKYTSQADRFDPYAVEDEGWDEATKTLVSDIFQLAGSASEMMSKVYGKINILRSKVRQETFSKGCKCHPSPHDDSDCTTKGQVRTRSRCGQGENPRPHAKACPLRRHGLAPQNSWEP